MGCSTSSPSAAFAARLGGRRRRVGPDRRPRRCAPKDPEIPERVDLEDEGATTTCSKVVVHDARSGVGSVRGGVVCFCVNCVPRVAQSALHVAL